MPTGVLKLKLRACRNMPDKRYYSLMEQNLHDANRLRNAIVRAWVRWREDNPEWEPGQRRDRKGEPKLTQQGKPAMEHPAISQEMEAHLYHLRKSVAPAMSSLVASGCWSKVISDLKDDMPYNHQGSAKVWQAILNYERGSPSYRGRTLPCPTRASTLIYSDDRFELIHPLLSKQSGYRVRSPRVQLVGYRSHGISAGEQSLIKRIAAGEIRRADSNLVLDNGEWYYHMVYAIEPDSFAHDDNAVAVLTPMRSSQRRPFELKVIGGPNDGVRWTIGDGIAYERAVARLTTRRKSIQHRYRYGMGKGHGRRAFYERSRRLSRGVSDAQDTLKKFLVRDVVRFCQRFGVGHLRYREPTEPLRRLSWFEQRGVPFDWTALAGFLVFKAESSGIVLEFRHKRKKLPVRIGVAEHKAEYPGQWPKKSQVS